MNLLLSSMLLAGPAVLAAAEPVEPSSTDLTHEEMEQFLLHAEILESETVPKGVTKSRRAILSDGTWIHGAQIQDVDIFMKKFESRSITEFNFRDCYRYNIAAYRLNRLLGMDKVPVSVERTIDRKPAAVTWWVDDVRFEGEEVVRDEIQPPDSSYFHHQLDQIRIFQQLVYNTDPNLGNFLVDGDWKIWMIDFTRAFRLRKKLRRPEALRRIGRGLYHRLQELAPDDVENELRPILTKGEIRGLLARRKLILRHFRHRIEELGERVVLFDRPDF
jgi:hypothetical protein